MTCPAMLTYPDPFDLNHRSGVVEALMSVAADGIVAPPDGRRWFQRDLNELVGRGWAREHRMRVDRLWFYRLTEAGWDKRAEIEAQEWLPRVREAATMGDVA